MGHHINHSHIQWQRLDTKPDLRAGQVHLWLMGLDVTPECLAKYQRQLTEQELKRAQRFHFERHQRRFSVARAKLREILAQYCDCPPEVLVFETNRYGKPHLTNMPHLQFNLSHSHEQALLAVTLQYTIGVDIEHIVYKERYDDIAKRFFSEKEFTDYMRVTDELKPQAFYHAWTRKEAFIKAIGMGLSFPLKDFDVTLIPGDKAKLSAVREHPEAQAIDWQLASFTPEPGYMGALVMQGENTLHFFHA